MTSLRRRKIHVVLGREEPRVDQHPAELAHLAPDHRVRPVLDVEVVVLHVGEDHPGQAELLVERDPVGIGGHQGRVLGGDPVPLGVQPLQWACEVLPPPHPGRVVADEGERDLAVLDPDPVGVVEAGARGEVEPRARRPRPTGPATAGPSAWRAAARRPRSGRRCSARTPSTPSSTASPASCFSSSSGRNRSTSMPGDHLRDRLVGDARERRACRSRRSRGRRRSRG